MDKVEVSRDFFEWANRELERTVKGPYWFKNPTDLEALRLYDEGQDILRKKRENR